MARQEGTILLTGAVGDLSFYKSRGKYFVRRKSGVSGDRIKSEPAFARTRENIAEFRRAVLATKLLRAAFSSLLSRVADNRVSSRLTGLMVRVVQGDVASARGERTVHGGNLALLECFEFNKHGGLSSTFRVPLMHSIDRASGSLNVDVPSFVPENMIAIPPGATHFKLQTGVASIDFTGNNYSTHISATADLPISEYEIGPLKLAAALPSRSSHPFFIVFGIQFLQSINGVTYPLDNQRYNAMAITKVDVCMPEGSPHGKESDLLNQAPLRQKARAREHHHVRRPLRRHLAFAGRKTFTSESKAVLHNSDGESRLQEYLDSS